MRRGSLEVFRFYTLLIRCVDGGLPGLLKGLCNIPDRYLELLLIHKLLFYLDQRLFFLFLPINTLCLRTCLRASLCSL